MKNQETDTYVMAVQHLENAIRQFGLPWEAFELLREPNRAITFSLPMEMDNGDLKRFPAFCSQHSNALGPYKGGMRIDAKLSLSRVKALGLEMVEKTSLIGLDFGGAKCGILVSCDLSLRERRHLIRRFIYELWSCKAIGPDIYIPAPDYGTNEKDMAIIMDTYTMYARRYCPDVVTGKPLNRDGLPGRRDATGRGVMICTMEALKRMRITPKDATVAVQGFGNVGSVSADLLRKEGCRIIAISDVSGAYLDLRGLDIPAMLEYCRRSESHSLEGYELKGMTKIAPEELLELETTVLIPAYKEGQITVANANRVKMKLMTEGANGPTTPEADAILFERDIEVVSDILANAGGVDGSHIEWVQSRTQFKFKEEEVNRQIEEALKGPFERIWSMAHERKLNFRVVAIGLAAERVLEAYNERGIFP